MNVVCYLSPSPKLSLIIQKSLITGNTFTIKDYTPSTIHHTLERLSVKYVETKLYRPTHLAPLPWFARNALKIKTRDSRGRIEDKAEGGKERV